MRKMIISLKVCSMLLVCLLILSSCGTLTNNSEKNRVTYEEIGQEFEKLDAYASREELSNYIGNSTYILCTLREERRENYGDMKIYTPIRAHTDLYINGYYYHRTLTDPREILFVLRTMGSYIQFSEKHYQVTRISSWWW